MDFDAVADELYGLPPGDFITTRDERAKAARAAGDRDLAERIHRLRRPSASAWASNLLVREQPDETERLLRLGQALRQAHQDLDGEQLRELSAQQRQVTSALVRHAGQLAARAGQRISESAQREVQETLHAVLADPEAARQWARGRLTKPLSAPVGFPALPQTPRAPKTAPAARRDAKRAGQVVDLNTARARRKEQQERLEQARQQAADAERGLEEREKELAVAREAQRAAEERRQQAEQRLAELSQQMKEAESEQRQARDAARRARDDTRDTDRAAREARRRAKSAATRARQLAEQLVRKR
ncbi:hypothetical protein IM697_21575 [Streptomyces ferrugineus]|uniref:Uncharacterized protein n=1 Tax=Streptomyces ferrugineus TaxID=1413221 RepID=A0A7M2SWL7_9ACTN|nr:hypothetical protein [Streptomyces ferrugineus]QOV40756.1 hypothetical protein IM697_21575 [Streptomyces ferrugineus]